MAADTNVLGLSVELQMNTLLAERALDDVTKKVETFNKSINDSIEQSISSIQAGYTKALDGLGVMLKNNIKSPIDEINRTVEDFSSKNAQVLSGLAKPIKDTSDAIDVLSASSQEFITGIIKPLNDIQKAITDLNKSNEEAVDGFNGVNTAAVSLKKEFESFSFEDLSADTLAIDESMQSIVGLFERYTNAFITFKKQHDEYVKDYTDKDKLDKEFFVNFDKYVEKFEKYFKKYKTYGEIAGQINDSIKDITKEYIEQLQVSSMHRDALNDIVSTYQNIASNMFDEGKALDRSLEQVDKLSEAIQEKNLHHQIEKDLVEEEGDLAKGLNETNKRIAEQVKNSELGWHKIEKLAYRIKEVLSQIEDIAENYHQATYRAYGSMYSLSSATYGVAMTTGLAARNVAEMMKELMHIAVPKEDLIILSETFVKVNRMTGIGAKNLALYAASLRNMALTTNQVKTRIDDLANTMQQYGLEAEDMNVLIDLNRQRFLALSTALVKQGEEAFNKSTAASLRFAKQLGINASEVRKFKDATFDNVMMLQAFTGMSIDSAADQEQAQLKLAQIINDRMNDVRGNYQQELMMQKMMMDQYGLSAEQLKLFMEQGKLLSKVGINPDAPDAVEKFSKAVKSAAPPISRLSDAMGTITNKLGALMSMVGGAFARIVIPVLEVTADALEWVVKALEEVTKTVQEWIDWWTSAMEEMEKTNPYIAATIWKRQIHI